MNEPPATDRDAIYADPLDAIAAFAFDERVVRVFPDMIQRSVPGYATIIAMTGVLAERYAQPGSRCYDLGCSLGASTLAMRRHLDGRDCEIVAVDNSTAMLERCRGVIAADHHRTPVTLQLADICAVAIENAAVVVLNFTLQFVPPARREALLATIGAGMRPGGVLVLSEKICFEDPHLQALNTDLHHAFKRAHGYSELEIAQKRSALENVLQPETLAAHQQRLRRAGFGSVDVWFQCFNFASLVAIR
jgi:tRNA (cmo5U34)-methyltransferase